jgi:hypothetical protein
MSYDPAVPTATQRGAGAQAAPGNGGQQAPSWRSERRRAAASRALAGFVLLVPVVLVCISFWPGHMNADTLTQIDGVRTGNVTDRHAWLLSEFWRVVWPLGVNAGWILAGTVITFMVGGYLVLRAALGPVGAAVGAAIVALLPQNFGSLGLIGRDIWFTALLVLAFGLLVRATQRTGRAQIALLVGALVAAILAQASRQNAITAMVVFFAGAAFFVYTRWGAVWRVADQLRSRRWMLIGGYAVCGVLASVLVAGALAIGRPAFGIQTQHPEQWLYIYDLAELSQREDRVLFSRSVFPAHDLAVLEQRSARDNVVPLVVPPDPPIVTPLPEAGFDRLSRDWREAVLDDPLEYLDVRWDLFMRQIAVTQRPTQIYHPVIDGSTLGYQIRFPDANNAAKDYVEAFADDRLNGNLLHATWLYLLIALGAAVILLRSGPPALKIVGLMAVAALLYQVGLFLGATGVGLRLEDPARIMALLAAIVAGASLVYRRRLTTPESATA